MSPTQQQRKAAARRKHQEYLRRREDKERRQRRRQLAFGAVVAAAVIAGAGIWAGGVFDDEAPPTADDPATSTEPTAPDSQSTKKPMQFDKPKQVLDKDAPATATLKTDHGAITIELATKLAPRNSNSLAFLAKQGYFDSSPCHRLTTGGLSVLQCGDPTGTGEGVPGYTVADENLPKSGDGNYPAASVAMAEPQGGDAGSQFFLVYRDSTLPPDYTIVGHISAGLDIVRDIAAAGIEGGSTDGAPADPVTIKSVVVKQA